MKIDTLWHLVNAKNLRICGFGSAACSGLISRSVVPGVESASSKPIVGLLLKILTDLGAVSLSSATPEIRMEWSFEMRACQWIGRNDRNEPSHKLTLTCCVKGTWIRICSSQSLSMKRPGSSR